MKTNAYLIIILFQFVANISIGQTSTQTIVNVVDGKFSSDLPHGAPFIIKGSAVDKTSGELMKKIKLTIIKPHTPAFASNVDKLDTVSITEWNNTDSSKIFELSVEKELFANQEYKVVFQYYMKKEIPKEALDRIVESVRKSIIDTVSKTGWSSNTIVENLIKNAQVQESKKYPDYKYISNSGALADGLNFSFPIEWISSVNNVGLNKSQISSADSSINESWLLIKKEIEADKEKRIIRIDTTKESTEVDSTIISAEGDTTANQITNEVYKYDTILDYKVDAEVKDILNQAKSYQEIDAESLINKLKLNQPTPEELSLIAELRNIKSKGKDVKDLKSKKRILDSTMFAVEDNLKKTKQLAVTSEIFNQNSTGTTEKSTDQMLGLKYGIAATPYDGYDATWFQYIVLRFYFVQVDKNMKSAYKRDCYRISFNLGMVLGDLNYKDRKLSNLEHLDMKLLTGFSVDITQEFNFDIGLVWFEDDAGDPFQSRALKAAFYTGVSFDFNIIERLKR